MIGIIIFRGGVKNMAGPTRIYPEQVPTVDGFQTAGSQQAGFGIALYEQRNDSAKGKQAAVFVDKRVKDAAGAIANKPVQQAG